MSWLLEKSKRCLKICNDELVDSAWDKNARDIAAFMAEQSLEFLLREVIGELGGSYKNYDMSELVRAFQKTGAEFEALSTLIEQAQMYGRWKNSYIMFGTVSVQPGHIRDCTYVIQSLYNARELLINKAG